MIRPKLVLKSNHQNNGLETDVSKTLGESNTNGSECPRQRQDSVTFICLAERHHLSLNTSTVLITIYYYKIIIIMTK